MDDKDVGTSAGKDRGRAHIHAPRHVGDWAADKIAAFVGSWTCVLLHGVWFSLWFLLRQDTGLLTNIVSLEAIFLCTFLLMSQNRAGLRDRARDDHEAAEVEELFAINQQLVDMNKTQLEMLAVLRERAGAPS